MKNTIITTLATLVLATGCATAGSNVTTSIPNSAGAYNANNVNWLTAATQASDRYFSYPASTDANKTMTAVKDCGNTIRGYAFNDMGQTQVQKASANANLLVTPKGCMLVAK